MFSSLTKTASTSSTTETTSRTSKDVTSFTSLDDNQILDLQYKTYAELQKSTNELQEFNQQSHAEFLKVMPKFLMYSKLLADIRRDLTAITDRVCAIQQRLFV